MSEVATALGGAGGGSPGVPGGAPDGGVRPRGAPALTDADVAALYRELGSRPAVARALGRPESWVRRALARAGQQPFPKCDARARRYAALDWAALYREHGSRRAVARAVGCDPTTALDRLIAVGVDLGGPNPPRFDPAEASRVARFAKSYGIKDAAEAMGCSLRAVRTAIRRADGEVGQPHQRLPRPPGVLSRKTALRRLRRAERDARWAEE